MKRENRLLGKCGVFAWEFDADALYITFFSSYYSSPPEKKTISTSRCIVYFPIV